MTSTGSPEELDIFLTPIEELKGKFSLSALSDKVKLLVPEECGFKPILSWEEFESNRAMLRFLAIYQQRTVAEYFISPQAELLYNLIELDAESQQDALGITVDLYKSKTKAKSWFRKLASAVHPDKCRHRSATRATEVLNRLYDEMVKHGR